MPMSGKGGVCCICKNWLADCECSDREPSVRCQNCTHWHGHYSGTGKCNLRGIYTSRLEACSEHMRKSKVDYTDSEQGQYEMMQAEQNEKDRQDIEMMIADYREVRSRVLELTASLFPAGSRVQPAGTTTGNWGATVREIDEHHRKHLSADMVFLDWDNGNKFPVRIDEIEHME